MKAHDLMTKAEVMDYLRISKGTLDKLMRQHKIPFVKFERAVRFRKSEVDKWLESLTVK